MSEAKWEMQGERRSEVVVLALMVKVYGHCS